MMHCPRFGKWIGGCKFEPRYDKSEPIIDKRMTEFNASPRALDLMRRETYVCDVCIRCGSVTARTPILEAKGEEIQ